MPEPDTLEQELKTIRIQGIGRFQVPAGWDDARIGQHIQQLRQTRPEIFQGIPSPPPTEPEPTFGRRYGEVGFGTPTPLRDIAAAPGRLAGYLDPRQPKLGARVGHVAESLASVPVEAMKYAFGIRPPKPPPTGKAEAVGQAIETVSPIPLGTEKIGEDISKERYGAAAGGALGLAQNIALTFLGVRKPTPVTAGVTIRGRSFPATVGQIRGQESIAARFESMFKQGAAGGSLRRSEAVQQEFTKRLLTEHTQDIVGTAQLQKAGATLKPAEFTKTLDTAWRAMRSEGAGMFEQVITELNNVRQGLGDSFRNLQMEASGITEAIFTAKQRGNFRDAFAMSQNRERIYGQMSKVVERSQKPELAALFNDAQAVHEQAMALKDFAKGVRASTKGAGPETVAAAKGAGFKATPHQLRGGQLLERMEKLGDRLTTAIGEKNALELKQAAELLRQAQVKSPAGHYALTFGLLLPGVKALMAGSLGPLVMEIPLLGGMWAISYALANPAARPLVMNYLRAAAVGTVSEAEAQRIVDIISQPPQAQPKQEKPQGLSPDAQRLQRDLSTKRATPTDAMLTAKEGKVTPSELNRVLREQKRRKLPRRSESPTTPIPSPPPTGE